MEYRFQTLELNGLKGVIGEHVARSFIRNQLAPRLVDDEGWNHVLLSHNDYKKHAGSGNKKLFSFDRFREDFIFHGFYANLKLLSKYATIVGILVRNHCSPDGLLLKLRETGRMKRLRENAYLLDTWLGGGPSKKRGGSKFPMVDGEIEVVEVKCGRSAKLLKRQKKTYNDLIAKGVPLRMVKVRIVSFDRNQFLVEEHRYDRFL